VSLLVGYDAGMFVLVAILWNEGVLQMKAFEMIERRISVRSYTAAAVSEELKQTIEELCQSVGPGPFGAALRFKLLSFEPLSKEELRRLGTYGMIKGARLYLLSAVKDGKGAMEDLGYCMEKIILEITALGLGTCWMAGTFKRSAFAEKMDLASGELLPAITPLGYAMEEMSAADRMIRSGAGSNRRKPWSALFFEEDGKTPLTEESAGLYSQALEAVRLGPSASNRQPWRLIRDNQGLYHLFLSENKIYNRMLGKIRIQNIDMGIAMSHFELVARDLGLEGTWNVKGKAATYPGLQYVATWQV
jgi:nitroreductase